MSKSFHRPKGISIFCAAIVVWLVQGCDRGPSGAPGGGGGSGGPRILATTGMVGDAVSRVAGPHAHVEVLMGPGVDPHLYKPSAGDAQKLDAADLIVYNGLNLEGKMGEVFEHLSRTKRTLAVTRGLPADRLRTPPEFQGHHDPHVWFDVDLWATTLASISATLGELDPAHASEYSANAAAYAAELGTLDAWVAREVASIPADRRVLVTAHDAFGYFGKRYSIDVVALQGISTAAELNIRDVERVVEAIVTRKVKAVFVESSVPRRNVEAIQKACEARGHKVSIGGELFSDAMGTSGTPEGTYRGMVEHNVRTIVGALK